MNYIENSTGTIRTALAAKLMTGIDFEKASVEKIHNAGYARLEYIKPLYDRTLYKLEVDGDLKPNPTSEGDFIQDFKIVPLPLGYACNNVKNKVTAKRWEVETGGIVLPDGTSVLTGIDDQNRIDSTISRMVDANIQVVKFKASSGWVDLTQEQVKAIGIAIALHVEACFARECALHQMCDEATTVEELKRIAEQEINEGWPVYERVAE